MFKKYFFILLFFFGLLVSAFSQNMDARLDSLKLKMENAHGSEKVELIDEYLLLLREKSRTEKEPFDNSDMTNSEKAEAFMDLGHKFFQNNSYGNALNNYQEALKLFKQVLDSQRVSYTLNAIGNIYYNWGDYNSSITYYTNSLKIKRELNDKDGLAYSHNGIANVYLHMEKYEAALSHYTNAYELSVELDDDKGKAYSLNAIGNIYYELKDYPTALIKYQAAFVLNEEADNQRGIGYTLERIGLIHLAKKNYDVAFKYFEHSLSIKRNDPNKKGLISILNYLGDLYMQTNRPHLAQKYYEESLQLATTMDIHLSITENYKDLAELFALKGNHKKAFSFYKTYKAKYDSIYNDRNRSLIERLQAEHKSEQQRKDIESISAERDLQKAQLKQQETINLFLISGLAAVLVFGFLLYRYYHTKIRISKKLEIEVAERKKTEHSLRKSEARFNLAMQGANDGLWDWNIRTNKTYYSPRWKQMLGYLEDEISNESREWKLRVHPDDFEQINKKLYDHIEGRLPYYETTYRLRHKDGHYIWVLDRALRVKDEYGQIYRMVGTQVDITKMKDYEHELNEHRSHLKRMVFERTVELEKAKRKAEESDKLKTAFLNNISHEIRTPLNQISGFVNLLHNNDLTIEQKKSYIQNITSASHDLAGLINDLISLSKIEAGQVNVYKSELYVNIFMDDLEQHTRMLLDAGKKEHIKLKVFKEFENKRNSIVTDAAKCRAILLKLIENAIKFTEHGSIEIGYAWKDKIVKFYVKDTGIGISPDQLEIIFNRFRKGEIGNSKLYGGTGLGLTIAKKNANLLGGKIWVESKLNQGTIFYLTLHHG